MRSIARRSAIALLIVGFTAASSLWAVTLVRMNLGDLCNKADKIFSGTVLEAKAGTVKSGGGEIPIMTYKVAVDDAFKGAFTDVKGMRIAEFRTLGKAAAVQSGNARRFSIFKDLPSFEVGRSYLLFTTAPVPGGLSTTVGLGQGNFRLEGKGEKLQATNGFGNSGLFAGMEAAGAPDRGPVSYEFLAKRIRAEVGGE